MLANGYVRVWVPGHPTASKDGYALEHRYVLHEAGVELPPRAHVHHINGDKTDNRPENLEVKSVRDHVVDHAIDRGYVENQHGRHRLREERSCERCGEMFLPWTKRSRFCSRDCSNKRFA